MKRKALSILMALSMALGCVTVVPAAETESEVQAGSEDVQWPTLEEKAQMNTKIEKITDDPVKLKIWIDFAPTDISNIVDDIQNINLLKILREKTGVDIELVAAPTGEGDTNFSLLLASDKMPDIILGFDGFYGKGGDDAIDQGIIYDLKDMIPQYAPHYEAARTASEYRRRVSVTDEGHEPYILQFVFQDQMPMTYGGPIIRKDILDKLGMDMPKTFDDWHEYLTRCKDELGMTRALGFSYNGISKYNAFNAAFDFAASDSAQPSPFYVKDGKVQFGAMSEGYKDYLALMAQWYQEGLIDPDFTSTVSFDDGVAMLSGDQCSASSDHSGIISYVNGLGQELDPDFNFVAAPYPVLEDGQQLHNGFIKGGPAYVKAAAITKSCEHPEIALQLIDQLYTDEGFMLCNYGVEGDTYNMVDGLPVFTDKVMNNEKGTPAHMVAAYAASAHWPFEYVLGHADSDDLNQYAEVWDVNNDYSYSFPNGVTLNTEENETYSKLYPDIETYVEETTVKYIMGLESLDDFDTFTSTLEDLGINDVLAAYQAAYNRFMQR